MGESKANKRKSSAVQAAPTREEDAGGREHVNVALPASLVERARELGLDASRYCETSLRKGVNVLGGVLSQENGKFFNQKKIPHRGKNSVRRPEKFPSLDKSLDEILEDFRKVLEIDKNLADRTVEQHIRNIRQFLKFVEDPWSEIDKDNLRRWLRKWKEDYAQSTYANKVKSLRVFFRDYLGSEIAEGLTMPQPSLNSINPPTKEQIQKLYKAMDSIRNKTVLLMFATTGLRRNELFSLTTDEIDFDKRMIIPDKNSRTKRTYVTFYNGEAEDHLERYLARKEIEEKLFSIRPRSINRIFRKTCKRIWMKNITPQDLRDWFVRKMRDLGVSGEHIDAFCGRLPRSVRGKHYTDYSQERLRNVYEEADLRVLD